MPRRSIKSSLDPKRFIQQDDLHKYRPTNSFVQETRREYIPKGVFPMNRVGKREATDSYRDRIVSDDPARPWDIDFALREVTNLQHQASKVVVAINNRKSKEVIIAAKRAYLDGLEANNLCFQCKCPIEVKQAPIASYRIKRAQWNTLLFWAFVANDQLIPMLMMNPVLGDVIKQETVRQKHGAGGGMVQKYRIPHVVRGVRKNVMYADIPSHFKWGWVDEDRKFAYYYYYDGTGRDIRLKRVPMQVKRKAKGSWERDKPKDPLGNVTITRFKEIFVEILEDGSEVPVVPETSYRTFQPKCGCPYRRTKTVKVRRV